MITLDKGVEVEITDPKRLTIVAPDVFLLSTMMEQLLDCYNFQFTRPTQCLDGKWATFGRRSDVHNAGKDNGAKTGTCATSA
jgi:hypothetical protein